MRQRRVPASWHPFSSARFFFPSRTCKLQLGGAFFLGHWRCSARHTQPLHAPGRTSSGSRTQRRNTHTQSDLLEGTWHAPGFSSRVRASAVSNACQISPASRRARKRGRLDAPDAKHANRRPTSSPFVAWTRFVAARALENAPRSSSARLRGARASAQPLGTVASLEF